MLTKLDTHNQLTLPESLLKAIEPTEYFEMAVVDGQITLTPVYMDHSAPSQPEVVNQGLIDEIDWAMASHNFIR
jgi:hypothetical protein